MKKNCKRENPQAQDSFHVQGTYSVSVLQPEPSSAVRNVEQTAADCLAHYPVKGKITLSALETSSLDHIMTNQEVFEHTYLHLILSDYMSITDV